MTFFELLKLSLTITFAAGVSILMLAAFAMIAWVLWCWVEDRCYEAQQKEKDKFWNDFFKTHGDVLNTEEETDT